MRNKDDGGAAGFAFVGLVDKETRDRCIKLWDGVAKTNLELPMGGGLMAPRPGNKAREVSEVFNNRDGEEAKRRSLGRKELELNLIKEAQKRRAVDYGRQVDLGNQYDASRATSAGNIRFNEEDGTMPLFLWRPWAPKVIMSVRTEEKQFAVSTVQQTWAPTRGVLRSFHRWSKRIKRLTGSQ